MPIHGYPGNVISATPPSVTPAGASGVFTTEQQMQYQTAGNWPMAATQISRSLRFNSADSAYLNRTPASAGNRKTWTWSGWVKRSALGVTQGLFGAYSAANNTDNLWFGFSSGDLFIISRNSDELRRTTQVFRDASAWYHIVVVLDTTQATANDRVKIYLNGTQITVFTTTNNPTLNDNQGVNQAAEHRIGRRPDSTDYLSSYLTEINFIDGQALTPASFGQTNSNTGIWEPRQYTGPYGTNGFYLNFSDNSGTTSTTLGKDYSGNGNNWTPNNFSVTAGVGNDSLVDTPTSYGTDTGVGGEVRGNYITFNELLNGLNLNSGSSLPNGNLQATTSTTSYKSAFLSMGITSGKWYCEFTWTAIGANAGAYVGVAQGSGEPQTVLRDATYPYIGSTANSYGYRSYDGQLQGPNDLTASYGNSYATNDVIGVALDMDSGKVWFSKNGTWQNSGSPTGGTNAAKTGLTDIVFIGASYYDTNDSVYVNTGQRPFAYTAPSGFKALCTQNLPTPTIGATSTTQANKYFDVGLWTGNGVNGRDIANLYNFNPDAVWIKSRSNAIDHNLADVLRSWKELYPNLTNAEGSQQMNAPTNNGLSGLPNANGYNINNYTYASWVWKANGAGSTNTAGTITSTVSANTTAGFSVVTWTHNNSTSTIGHGLGVAPQMIIAKTRNGANDWFVYMQDRGATKTLYLNLTNAEGTTSAVWGNTAPTSTVFTASTTFSTNTCVAYCFAAVAGYSAFGSYTANGSSDGPFVYTGFRPKYLMIKSTATAGTNWWVLDSVRNTYNVLGEGLFPQTSAAAASATVLDFLSNGFKIRAINADFNNGTTDVYIYAAFAESPFKYALAR